MAEFTAKCPHCSTELVAEEDWIGMEVECPTCGQSFILAKEAPKVPKLTLPPIKPITPAASANESADAKNNVEQTSMEELTGSENDNVVRKNKRKIWVALAIGGVACLLIAVLIIILSSYLSIESTANRKISSLKENNLEILHPYIEKKIRSCKSRSEIDSFNVPDSLRKAAEASENGDVSGLIELYKAYLDPDLLDNKTEAAKILYSLASKQEPFAIQVILKKVTDGENTTADNEMLNSLAAQNNELVINYFKQRNVLDDLMFDIMQNAMKNCNEDLWQYLYQIGFRENRQEYIELCGKFVNPDPSGEKALVLADYYKVKQKDLKSYGKWLRFAANRRNKYGLRRCGHFLLTQPNENRALGVSFLKLNKNDSVSMYYLGKYYSSSKNNNEKKLADKYLKKAIMLFKQEIQTTQDPEVKYSYAICCLYPYDGSTPQVGIALKILNELADGSYDDALITLAYLYDKGYLSIRKSEEKSIIYIKLLADKGHPSFQYLYGASLAKQKKYTEAFTYYTQAANQKDINSICALGIMYKRGLGCKQDLSKARSYLETASSEKNIDAMVEYASMLLNGEGGSKDAKKAESLLKDVLKQKNSVIAAEMLADMYWADKKENDAYHYYYIASISGSKKAKEIIADFQKSFDAEKVKIQELLSKGKNEEAKILMSKYENIDIPEISQFFCDYYINIKDYETARSYCKNSFGSADTYRNYGIMLFHGLGGEKDIARAKRMFLSGARLNDSECINYLGYMSAVGIEGPEDASYAAKLFTVSARMKNVNAMRNLGLVFSAGLGVPRDFKKASQYYTSSLKLSASKEIKQQAAYIAKLNDLYLDYEDAYHRHQAQQHKTGRFVVFRSRNFEQRFNQLKGNTRYHFYISDIHGNSLLCQHQNTIVTWPQFSGMLATSTKIAKQREQFEKQNREREVIERMIRDNQPPENMCPVCGGAGYRIRGQSIHNVQGQREQCYMCHGTGIKP